MNNGHKVTIEFYFDFMSPYSYLANTQLPLLCERGNANLVYKPVLMPELFRLIKRIPEILKPERAGFVTQDLRRWSKWYGVSLKIPEWELTSMESNMAIAYQVCDSKNCGSFVWQSFHALWSKGEDITDEKVLSHILTESGLDPAEWLSKLTSMKLKDALLAGTAEAAKRGVFQLPTFCVNEDMFVGNNSLPFIAATIGLVPFAPAWV